MQITQGSTIIPHDFTYLDGFDASGNRLIHPLGGGTAFVYPVGAGALICDAIYQDKQWA